MKTPLIRIPATTETNARLRADLATAQRQSIEAAVDTVIAKAIRNRQLPEIVVTDAAREQSATSVVRKLLINAHARGDAELSRDLTELISLLPAGPATPSLP